MEYTNIGNTDVKVSKICLGSMTWGEQNTEIEAHEQLDYALKKGINFIDTAELYAVPARKETYGLTEKYIGTWLKKTRKRNEVIIASKIAGYGKDITYIRGGSKFNRQQLTDALNGSLKRLQTDYIDLYQLHWPERKTNFFGKLGYIHHDDDLWENNFREVLEILQGFIKEGKIRHIGLSNETPWGTSQFLKLSELHDLPRMVSIQNPYNLLNRIFEVGLAEMAIREKTGLLAYSPLAFGLLSGKYFKPGNLDNARINLFPKLSRYNHLRTRAAAEQYVVLANKHNLNPAQMALAFINQQPFVTSNIIGATTIEQLKENIDSIQLKLPDEILEEIEEIHLSQPNPAP
jgi:aryl-alcohol dehydrogenase-like predicted oxidoreductase